MDSPVPMIRVKALQPQRRRAGMLFTREARDLMPGDLGEGIEAGEALLALVSDPQLQVTGIDADGMEHAVTAAMVEELVGLIDADRAEQQADLGATPDPAALDAAGETAKPDTAGPQDDGVTPAVGAPQAGGPEATANASPGSAVGAGTTATAQADIEPPAAKPSGRSAAKRSGDKPAKSGT